MTTIFVAEGRDEFKIKIQSADSYTFHYLVNALKRSVPSHERSFDPELKEWRIRREAHTHVFAFLRLARSLDAEIEDTTESDNEQAPPSSPDPESAALKILHLTDDAPPQLIKSAFLTLCKIHHPDKGGDVERMKQINLAFERLKNRLAA